MMTDKFSITGLLFTKIKFIMYLPKKKSIRIIKKRNQGMAKSFKISLYYTSGILLSGALNPSMLYNNS